MPGAKQTRPGATEQGIGPRGERSSEGADPGEAEMETLLEGQESLRTVDALTRRLVDDAKRNLRGVADEALLEACAREAVEELWHDSIKVTSFVPVLAMRRLREMVSAREAAGGGVVGER